MGLQSFLLNLFNPGPPVWQGSPEAFLTIVMKMQMTNDKKLNAVELLKWGEVMQKIIKVDLAPYESFYDLALNGTPDYNLLQQLDAGTEETNRRIELKKAIYGKNVDLKNDDFINSEDNEMTAAREMVKELSKHVIFSQDDQKIIDGFK